MIRARVLGFAVAENVESSTLRPLLLDAVSVSDYLTELEQLVVPFVEVFRTEQLYVQDRIEVR